MPLEIDARPDPAETYYFGVHMAQQDGGAHKGKW
jgi:hypothetical protein